MITGGGSLTPRCQVQADTSCRRFRKQNNQDFSQWRIATVAMFEYRPGMLNTMGGESELQCQNRANKKGDGDEIVAPFGRPER